MISKELRGIFTQAVGYAKSSKHEYLTLEHIFLMLIHDQTIENLFLDLGVDTDKLFEAVVNISTLWFKDFDVRLINAINSETELPNALIPSNKEPVLPLKLSVFTSNAKFAFPYSVNISKA